MGGSISSTGATVKFYAQYYPLSLTITAGTFSLYTALSNETSLTFGGSYLYFYAPVTLKSFSIYSNLYGFPNLFFGKTVNVIESMTWNGTGSLQTSSVKLILIIFSLF
jgi:hypothetical protein